MVIDSVPANTKSAETSSAVDLSLHSLFTNPTEFMPVKLPSHIKPWQIDLPMPGGLTVKGAQASRGVISRVIGWLFTKSIARQSAVNIGGITAKEAATLKSLLLKIPGAEGAGAFGSRTVGTFAKESDLDIVLFGQVNRSDPATIGAVRQAQEYAQSIGIGLGQRSDTDGCPRVLNR